ncbi:hypothetical protein AB6A40_011354 [Gnathostoma spinigerum]|uniref:Uncharacterized protein n=1 Tax=Gnathostoma spinigerum TaxID=75299 RepID=A0ABD6F4K9_9BILA
MALRITNGVNGNQQMICYGLILLSVFYSYSLCVQAAHAKNDTPKLKNSALDESSTATTATTTGATTPTTTTVVGSSTTAATSTIGSTSKPENTTETTNITTTAANVTELATVAPIPFNSSSFFGGSAFSHFF